MPPTCRLARIASHRAVPVYRGEAWSCRPTMTRWPRLLHHPGKSSRSLPSSGRLATSRFGAAGSIPQSDLLSARVRVRPSDKARPPDLPARSELNSNRVPSADQTGCQSLAGVPRDRCREAAIQLDRSMNTSRLPFARVRPGGTRVGRPSATVAAATDPWRAQRSSPADAVTAIPRELRPPRRGTAGRTMRRGHRPTL